jgi:UPF0755 protein
MKIHPAVTRLFLLAAALMFGIAGIYTETVREQTPHKSGGELEVLILPGLGAREAAAEFERAGAVTSAAELARWMGRLGIDRRIRPGIYRITPGRPRNVADQLAAMKPEALNVTVLPGALFEEIASALGQDGADKLAEALGREENFTEGLRPLLPEKIRDRAVFLAPETYALNHGGDAADDLVKFASALWWRRHGDKIPDGATASDLASLGVLASIVQKEALIDSDRPVIAGVFKNRLLKDMPLQSCATVVHAWRLEGVKKTSVSYNDVKIDSPFNTYIHKGLPPENIGAPSESSWNAALRPADTDMLFFFAGHDGAHVFTRTYKEHLEAQEKSDM